MKCQSVACIWSDSPPLHRVTATAVLNQPPTLYTGGSDGSIIWWNLSSNQSSHQKIWPVAMLCGHAAKIVDLDICFPVTMGGHGEIENTSNVVVNSSSSAGYGALISACTDGVLCIWSRTSGHCKRRRKMPPWVGTPSAISTLPASPRYVCVACCCVDSAHSSGHQYSDPAEGGEASVDREYHNRRGSKCAIVIFDTYSLNIVQTVFHGSLSIGPLKFMAVVLSAENYGKQSVVLSDSIGGLQSILISKDSETDGKSGTALRKSSSQMGISAWVDGLVDEEHLVSIAAHGEILALICRTCCIFRLVGSGIVIGKIDLVDSPLCDDSDNFQSHLVGGMFLSSDDGGNALDTHDQLEQIEESFTVWSNRGAAIVFTVSGSHDTFKYEPFCEIPAVSHPLDVRVSVNFRHLNGNLIRIESICSVIEESFLWKPHITIWLLCQQHDAHGKFGQQCRMLGEGGFPSDWIGRSSSPSKIQELKNDACVTPTNVETEVILPQSCVPESVNVNGICGEESNNDRIQRGRAVSSSLVLFENLYTPYGIVYGFYTGEIKVVRFGIFFQELDSFSGSPHHAVEPHVFEQFSGHTGPILCLAAHRMLGSINGQNCSWVLVSGSMDCTIRVWDLDTSNLITVMHHHVAPVRQIILPPPHTDRPWSDCFVSVGEDSCVALASLETLRVERMFPGHLNYPAMVVWDGVKGYIACLCKNHLEIYNTVDVLYLWDVKTGARERVLRGTASHSMFDHFCRGININSITDSILGGSTSASSLLFPIMEDGNISRSHSKNLDNGVTSLQTAKRRTMEFGKANISVVDASKGKSAEHITSLEILQNGKHPVKCSCPFPGIATLRFDLSYLMFPCQSHTQIVENGGKQENASVSDQRPEAPSSHCTTSNICSDGKGTSNDPIEEHEWVKSLEGCLIRFSLSLLHLWGVDHELDRLLISEMNVIRPESFIVASGLQGDRGSVTLTFPGPHATLELWRSSSEFCAIRSLTMVSLAQRMISLSRSSSAASCALAAFYMRKIAEIVPDIKPPSLQLLVSFWQDESEHVRMAARSLFHCAASRAIPHPLCGQKVNQHASLSIATDVTEAGEEKHLNTDETSTSRVAQTLGNSQAEESAILAWLESFEMQDWISCVGGTSQDAMASLIIVAAALAVWYPSLVKPSVAQLVVHPLLKLVMAMSEKYSSTAAELLAEGMESTWKACIGPEIPRLIGDIFFQIECVSGASANSSPQNPAVSVSMRDTLVGILLPSLAMADVPGFLSVIESQIWSTASDSPVHLVSLMTLIRVLRGSPKPLAQFLDKVVNFILQTMDHANSVLRRACLPSSMHALKDIVRVFPMVSLNEGSTRLAVGDAIGDIHSVAIRIYDMQSVTIVKVLDASGPPGLPSLLGGASETMITTGISALSFSPNGEGLVAFSEHGLMIRWWSLESGWWEKLSRSLVPIQCTKLIFVPPWEGFSPNSSRSSVMATITGHDRQVSSPERTRGLSDVDSLKLVLHNLDLSYRIEWVGERKLILTRHGHELGSFQLSLGLFHGQAKFLYGQHPPRVQLIWSGLHGLKFNYQDLNSLICNVELPNKQYRKLVGEMW
ncbi:WD40 repeat [Macleaya cordata]|uniref:WD40 repeat n=1 Tax=Macleaya cordata TaxID=56857 RepID=A0A200PV74_MACCD|nr:WD40 repeat [Macleaya cordata]